MEKIKIITDSTSDLPEEIIKKYDIEVMPLTVNVGGNSYKDGEEIRLPELLKIMREQEKFPTTAQITPLVFLETYRKYLNEGYKILSLHLSSAMSGTYQSACIAKEMLESEDIEIIDSNSVTSGLGIIVIKACKLRDEGKTINEISEEIKEIIPHVKGFFIFESLDNLVKGGRLSRTVGVIGNILNIRLILCLQDGELFVKDKVRGTKKATKELMNYLENIDVNKDETNILLNADNEEVREVMYDYLKSKDINFIETDVGCVVGVHSGPGACGFVVIENKSES